MCGKNQATWFAVCSDKRCRDPFGWFAFSGKTAGYVRGYPEHKSLNAIFILRCYLRWQISKQRKR